MVYDKKYYHSECHTKKTHETKILVGLLYHFFQKFSPEIWKQEGHNALENKYEGNGRN